MGTFRQRNRDLEPSILVGWAAGVLRPWPEETDEPIRASGSLGEWAAAERDATERATAECTCVKQRMAS